MDNPLAYYLENPRPFSWQKVLVAIIAAISVVIVFMAVAANNAQLKNCNDMTVAQLNHVYENSILQKISGMKFLDIISASSIYNPDTNLHCRITAITTSGKMDFMAETLTANGSVYITVKPVF